MVTGRREAGMTQSEADQVPRVYQTLTMINHVAGAIPFGTAPVMTWARGLTGPFFFSADRSSADSGLPDG